MQNAVLSQNLSPHHEVFHQGKGLSFWVGQTLQFMEFHELLI